MSLSIFLTDILHTNVCVCVRVRVCVFCDECQMFFCRWQSFLYPSLCLCYFSKAPWYKSVSASITSIQMAYKRIMNSLSTCNTIINIRQHYRSLTEKQHKQQVWRIFTCVVLQVLLRQKYSLFCPSRSPSSHMSVFIDPHKFSLYYSDRNSKTGKAVLVQCDACSINFESGNGNFPSLALLDIPKLFNFMLHFIFHIHFVDHDENASVLHFSTLKADICHGIHNQILIL